MQRKIFIIAAFVAATALSAQSAPAQNPDDQLENAIPLNDAKAVKAAIKAGANPNRRVWAGHLLGVAATNGYTNSVRALVENGADVNNSSSGGWTALMGAADNGHLEIAKILVAKKADVNARTRQGRTALMRSAFHGQTAVVQYLLGQGAKATDEDSAGVTALMLAAQQGHHQTVKVLVDAGSDKAKQNAAQKTALVLTKEAQAANGTYRADDFTKTVAILTGAEKKSIGKQIGKVFRADGKKLVITGKGIGDVTRGQKLKIKISTGEITATVKETLHSKIKATANKSGAKEGDAVYLDK